MGRTTCALDQGQAKCWGDNGAGQLGLGDRDNRGAEPSDVPSALGAIQLGSDARVADIATGDNFSCALLVGGAVKCWGGNDFGQLGQGDRRPRGAAPGELGAALPAVELGAGPAVAQIAAGAMHACALLVDGAVKCWGRNDHGQLGTGDASLGDDAGEMGDALPAVALPGGASALALGENHSCALLVDGGVACWGDNAFGQLGLGDAQRHADLAGRPALRFAGEGLVSRVFAGRDFCCVLMTSGAAKCWGQNDLGQLGRGDVSPYGDDPLERAEKLDDVALGADRIIVSLSVGARHVCAALDDGSVKCWGYDSAGQLGLGDHATRGSMAGQMGDALPRLDLGEHCSAGALAAGDAHTCAVLSDHSVKCWGDNAVGQLGLGDPRNRGDGPAEMGDALPKVELGSWQ